jgi:matrix metalloproteinase-14 (membrane-inserted)
LQVYLVRYGYLNTPMTGKSANLLSSDMMKESIYSFQRFAGLNETGELDDETLRMMSLPRCGVKDMVGHGLRAKRYALQGKQRKSDRDKS